jgi:magnesium transporter
VKTQLEFVATRLIGLGKDVFHPFRRLAGGNAIANPAPGSSPGIEAYLRDAAKAAVPVEFSVTDYGPELHETRAFDSVDAVLEAPRPKGASVRWINVNGLNPVVIDRLCRELGVHTLAAEDVLNVNQRPKLESFKDHLLVIVRQIRLHGERLRNEQVSLFCFGDLLLSFQEEPGDVFDPVRRRIENPASRFRSSRADYLLYALIDSMVDHLFPLLEGYAVALDDLEEEISGNPGPSAQRRIFAMKRDVALQRRAIWPIREVVDGLYREESDLISPFLKTYLRDVQDHAMQVIDLLESYRETASSLHDLYQTTVSNRMNEIMKVLTIMASFFIPLTFIAGVYGMNFEHIPELAWRPAYLVFWLVCGVIAVGLAVFFKRRGWIGRDR